VRQSQKAPTLYRAICPLFPTSPFHFYPCFYFGNFKRLLAYFLSPLFLFDAAAASAFAILFNFILFYILLLAKFLLQPSVWVSLPI